MVKSKSALRLCAFALIICPFVAGLPLQDIGGTLAFSGQDIIGGAAIIFKAPKRVRDLAGNTAAMLAAKRPSRSNRPSEVARNNRPATQPTATTVATTPTTTTAESAEALKEQANRSEERRVGKEDRGGSA